jgi:hypothetical protein
LSVLGLSLIMGMLAAPGRAAVSVTVDSESPPWEWSDALNSSYRFGMGFVGTPTLVSASAVGSAPGDWISIAVTGGSVSAYPPLYPYVDGSGAVVVPGTDPNAYTGPTDDFPGDSGNGFPSRYMVADWPVRVMSLVGTFADMSGNIVGTPFKVGLQRNIVVPDGAGQLQLGVNDDVFGDNGGSFEVTVALVPEPGTSALLACGLVLLGTLVVRRRGVARETWPVSHRASARA